MTHASLRALPTVVLALSLWNPAQAQEWTRFRGPDGSGVGKGDGIPIVFGEADYDWNVSLPGRGHSSPVLWGQKLFVTCSQDQEERRQVVCLNAVSGAQEWAWQGTFARYKHHRDNSYAASTPAVDADRVYVSWVSGQQAVVIALDHGGDLVWHRVLGSFKGRHGAGGSPIVLGGTLIVCNDNASGDSFLTGLDPATGDVRWRLDRRSRQASYITPPVYRPAGGTPQVVFCSPPHGLSGHDPATGKMLWESGDHFTLKSVASPVVAGGVVFATTGKGGAGKESAAVRPGAKAEIAYSLEKDLPYVPTPIAVGDLLFVWSDRGVVTCVEPATGAVVWRQQVGGGYYSSPVCVNGRIYCITRQGEMVVIEASRTFKELGRCKLPEGTHATPAIANGRMYIRTFSRVLSVGGPGR